MARGDKVSLENSKVTTSFQGCCKDKFLKIFK